jgi:hypothetical protein
VSVCHGGVLLALLLMVPSAVFGESVRGAGALSSAGPGQGSDRGSVLDSVVEYDLLPQRTEKALEPQSRRMEGGEVPPTPLQDEVQRQEPADEMQKLTLLRPNWQQIVGRPGSATVFRRWLAKQPKAYQRMIESASTAAELNESIEEFLASDDYLVAAHLEELDVKLAEMRARAREQSRHGDEEPRLK